jgi:branched-chain amino acid transport system ATP-binding protein
MSASQTPMLELSDVHTYYGQSQVLYGVSLAVQPGEVVCLLGRNGVGKTTTIRTIAGLTPARRGTVAFRGLPIERLAPHQITRLGIGLVPQGRRIFSQLTVAENLRIASRAGGGAWTLEKVVELFPRLSERLSQLGGSLSGGEQQMLAIGRALMGNPQLVLMDEPSEGLAPQIVRVVRDVIAALREQRLAILLIEQKLPMALSVSDRVYVMSRGKIVFRGSPGDLDANKDVKARFLGVAASEEPLKQSY